LTAKGDEPIYWQDTEEGKAWAEWAYKQYLSSYFNGFPKWVKNHYARIKEINGVCDIPDCNCHWVDSLKRRKA
jgi:hypothetical protein